MPTPVACLLKRPEMTFSLGRSGRSGSRLLPSVMSAPEPLADQFGGLIPLPMNSAAKRLGCAVAAVEADCPRPNGIASSHGRAIETPTPWRSVRRVNLRDCSFDIANPQGEFRFSTPAAE